MTSDVITITPASVRITALPPQGVYNKHKKLISVRLRLKLQSLVPGAAPPSGVIDIELARKGRGPSRPKVIGIATAQNGTATVSLASSQVLNKTLSVFFAALGYEAPDLTLPRLTTTLLRRNAIKAGD